MSEDAKNEDAENKERLKARTRRFLEAAQVVTRGRKADSIYTVFRKLIRKEPVRKEPVRKEPGGNKGWLQHQIEQDATLLPMMRELGQYYEELTGILERLQPKG
jgi:hypothetical protein